MQVYEYGHSRHTGYMAMEFRGGHCFRTPSYYAKWQIASSRFDRAYE